MKGLRVGLVIVAALTIQLSLLSDLRVFGAAGDVMLLLGIAAGIVGGPQRGAVVGFAAGMAFDSQLQTPFGLSALTYCLTGYAVGLFQGSVLRSAWWIPVASAVVASSAGVVAFAVAGEVLGQEAFLTSDLVAIAIVVAVLNGALCPVAVRAMRWALEGARVPRRPRRLVFR